MGAGRGQLGVWDVQIQIAVYKTDKGQGPAVLHRELYSVSRNDVSWKRIHVRMCDQITVPYTRNWHSVVD